MHELSIVKDLISQVTRLTPPGTVVRSMCLRVGPLQAIDPLAIQWAWQAATQGTPLDHSRLCLEYVPWRMRCPDCDREWDSTDPLEHCACGCDHPHPSGDLELTLVSIDVEDASSANDPEVSP